MCAGILLICQFTPPLTLAQNAGYEVKGVVVDKSGMPILGATVVEKGTTNGVSTGIDGDYAIRASYDGAELGLKKVSKDTAKTYFQLTDLKDKTAFLTMTAHKTYEPELAVMRRTQKTSVGLGL